MTVEKTILNNLINHEDFARKAIPFLRTEYFHDNVDKTVFELIDGYLVTYNNVPTKQALLVDLDNRTDINEDTYSHCKEYIETVPSTLEGLPDVQWLVDTTEKFCQDKAIYNAILQAVKILEDKDSQQGKGAIPQILSDALAVSFDTSVGHDYMEDAESRYENLHKREKRIAFDIELLNKITNGGLPQKTLNVILAGTGVGKSLFMCHCAANNLTQGHNVLYITLELSEERVAERIDANLMNVGLGDMRDLPKEAFIKMHKRIKSNTIGRLVVKEYPTACAGAANFRHLLNELKVKKNFIPDIVYIDYINICSSSRMKQGANVNSYTYIKAIAEELRGLAVEFVVPIVTATQTTRGGYDSSDVGLTDTSESFGLPATADFMIALMQTDELKELNQIMVKQLKNRYSDPETFKRFILGVDKPKMRIYNADDSAQEDIMEEVSAPPTTGKFDKAKLAGLK